MATQTPNFNFDLRESADIFNPLSTNANFESLDTILKNLQETGGITTYTTTASANLLKLSGTPKVNDTVFKFVAAGDANTWTAATGGVINNIVGLDGVKMTIKGGNMYVAWINSANAMVCVVWPEVVNAQTFDGKGPSEWATKVQLDAVNETAGNATQTAQAAATVANNALEVAKAAGMKMTKVWTNPNPSASTFSSQTIQLGSGYENAKLFAVLLGGGTASFDQTNSGKCTSLLMNVQNVEQVLFMCIFGDQSATRQNMQIGARSATIQKNGTIYLRNGCFYGTIRAADGFAVPMEIYALS